MLVFQTSFPSKLLNFRGVSGNSFIYPGLVVKDFVAKMQKRAPYFWDQPKDLEKTQKKNMA